MVLDQFLNGYVAILLTISEIGNSEGLELFPLSVLFRDVPVAVSYEVVKVNDGLVSFALL